MHVCDIQDVYEVVSVCHLAPPPSMSGGQLLGFCAKAANSATASELPVEEGRS